MEFFLKKIVRNGEQEEKNTTQIKQENSSTQKQELFWFSK